MATKGPEKAAFIDKLVKDAASPPRVKLLTGYVGTSSETACVRIYKDAELTEYLEVPNAAILHSEVVADDPLGASRIWVDKDADLISRGAEVAEMRGRFLAGPIAGMGAPAGRAAIPQSAIDNCPSALIECYPPTSQFIACGPIQSRLCSWNDGCPSAWIECPPQSQFVVCNLPPVQSRLSCSWVDGCPSAMIECVPVSEVGCGPIVSQVCSWDDGCASSLGCTVTGTIYERINPGRFRARPRYRGF